VIRRTADRNMTHRTNKRITPFMGTSLVGVTRSDSRRFRAFLLFHACEVS